MGKVSPAQTRPLATDAFAPRAFPPVRLWKDLPPAEDKCNENRGIMRSFGGCSGPPSGVAAKDEKNLKKEPRNPPPGSTFKTEKDDPKSEELAHLAALS